MNTDELAAKLIAAMAADPRFKGPKGDRGIDGLPGRDGKSPEIDYDRLAAEMVKRMPPMTFEILQSGRVADTRVVPLGGTLQLQLPERRN